MYPSNDLLQHQHHLDQYRWALNGSAENDAYFTNEAAQMHALVVIDAVADLQARAIHEGEACEGELQAHLVYGVGRRTGDIWAAMREIVAISPVDRTAPLSIEQASTASRALNTIYINIRGVLDNFAWTMIEKAGGLSTVSLNFNSVDLFGARFSQVAEFVELAGKLSVLTAWSADVKDRRNPAAHRIPLAVIPAVLTPSEAEEVQRLTAEMLTPIRPGGLDLDDGDKLLERHKALKLKIERIGAYRPMFAHMPSDGAMPLYPTVAQDVGQMVRAGRIVLDHLAAAHATR